jgi:hypothetical protein
MAHIRRSLAALAAVAAASALELHPFDALGEADAAPFLARQAPLASAPGALTDTEGFYSLDATATAQIIEGFGVEIQSDSIGSGNDGLPASNSSVPVRLG